MKTTITTLILLFFTLPISAQVINNSSDLSAQDLIDEGKGYLLTMVDRVDEFIGLYNTAIRKNDQQRLSNLIDKVSIGDTLALQNFKSNILSQQQPLSYYDNNWYALVNCNVLYKGKPQQIQLVMELVSYEPDMRSEWVFNNAYAPFLSIEPECDDTTTFISPVANNTNFVELQKAFNNRESITAYGYQNFEPDNLSILFHEIKSGDVVLQNVSTVQYVFAQLDNYIFTLSYFNRKASQSGWLVSQIKTVANEQKNTILKQQFNIKQ